MDETTLKAAYDDYMNTRRYKIEGHFQYIECEDLQESTDDVIRILFESAFGLETSLAKKTH